MANTVNNIKDGPGLFAKGMAQTLKDNLGLCAFVEKADESEYDGKNGYKAGDTIYTSIPTRRIVQEDNLDITSYNTDVVEEKAPLVLNKTATTADSFDSLELATEVDVKSALKRFGIPSAQSLAQQIEARCMGIVADSAYNITGTAGSNSFAVADVLAARSKLNQNLAPLKDRMLFLNSESGAEAVDARKGLFQSSTAIAEQYSEGYIGRSDGFDWMETELLPTHTNGSMGGTPLMDGATAEGASTLHIDGVTSGNTWTKGTKFTVAGVYMVHPITKAITKRLQQFVATADVTFTGGEADVPVSPSIYASATSPLKNVDAVPADGAAITILTGAASTGYVHNLALHKSAFKMVTVPLYTPKGEELVASETVDGITVNIVRFFDGNTRIVKTRYDVLYAFDEVRPEWSNVITS